MSAKKEKQQRKHNHPAVKHSLKAHKDALKYGVGYLKVLPNGDMIYVDFNKVVIKDTLAVNEESSHQENQ